MFSQFSTFQQIVMSLGHQVFITRLLTFKGQD